MRVNRIATLLAGSHVLLGVSAGPLAAKRQQDESTSSSPIAPTVGLVVGTMSDGTTTTFEAFAPQPSKSGSSESTLSTGDASVTTTATEDAASGSATPSRTGQPPPPSTAFPVCHTVDDPNNPFCLPNNMSTLYVGKTYYATWNPDRFPLNSTVTVKVMFSNDSTQEVWSSAETDNSWGFVTFKTNKYWKQGYSAYNLTFHAVIFEGDDPTKQATPKDGPQITITDEPPDHYPPPEPTKAPNKEGLMIGLPVSLGFVLLVVVGLWFGMRKRRTIGLGNIMGRRNKGYGVGKSRSQRLGLGKKGAIRLEEREIHSMPQYTDRAPPTHSRGDSLGSLVSDDEIRPAPKHNQFRDEINRQKADR
ncbi:hypothetical protein CC78DRAFT_617865 [Lojkania enalia]|uniref:Uncharacterized protein n=1 Tax=Lojkania enalia TaxID=147567 RepID=A0A9P4KAW7_9PLEO|nr:hypothetical protein CC78DRAFT_617865 [Didymosphaeria enalia]